MNLRECERCEIMKRSLESDDDDDDEIDDESFETSPLQPKKIILEDISWVDKYSPKSIDQLCINPSKLKQLKTSMNDMIHNNKRILIVSGPSGSAKSTSVKLIANQLSKGFVEYIDGNFEEFLNDCKYLVGSKLKFVVLENLPNIYHPQTLTKFRGIIDNWLYIDQQLPPLIICLTEIETTFQENHYEFFNIQNNLNVNTVFGKLAHDSRIEIVKFNPIAKKFMLAMLNKIISNEPVFKKIPKFQVQEFLKNIDMGDIRSSINNLEFRSRFYIKGNTNSEFNRNSSIDLFHAIGKVIYSSSNFRHLQDKEEINSKTVNEVINNYENLQLLHLNILENYLNLVNDNDLITMEYISNKLSESELIYNLDEGKDLMIRSTRYGLDNKASNTTSSFKQVKFTKNHNMMKRFNSVSKIIYSIKPQFHTSFNNLNMIDGFYVPKIRHNKYGRIGGKFKVVSDDLYEEEEELSEEFKVEVAVDEDDELSDPLESDSDAKPKKSIYDSDYEFSDDDEFV